VQVSMTIRFDNAILRTMANTGSSAN